MNKLNLTKILPVLCLTILFNTGSAFSQDSNDGINSDAEFVFDFQTTLDDTQTVSVIENSPVIENNRFTVTLVLSGVENLCGVNCDIKFDPAVLKVVDIHEARGDLNYDGRSNIADILTLGERFGDEVTDENGFEYFNRNKEGDSANIIDMADISTVLPFLNERNLFWTSNANNNLDTIRESVEIFPTPEVIQNHANETGEGLIDDIVAVLLPREHPVSGFAPEGFGFDGPYARIADITFEIIGGDSGSTTEITIEDRLAIDENTIITASGKEGESIPQGNPIAITLP